MMKDFWFQALSYEKALLFVGIFMAVCILVIVAIMLDLWDGVHTAKSTGQRVHSHKLRVTISKMSEYWRFILIGFLVDCLGIFFHFYILPFVVVLFGVGLIVVEAKSMFEHARERKSHTAELPDLLKKIISASNKQEAREALDRISDFINSDNSSNN